MSDNDKFEAQAYELAREQLQSAKAVLDGSGLEARLDPIREWEDGGGANSELRISIWRDSNLVDVIETFLRRDGRALATISDLERWLTHALEDVLGAQDSEGVN